MPRPDRPPTPRESAVPPAGATTTPLAALPDTERRGGGRQSLSTLTARQIMPRGAVLDRTPVPWKVRVEGRRAAESRRRALERTIGAVGGAVTAFGVTIAAVLPPSPFAPVVVGAIHALPAHYAKVERDVLGFALSLVPSGPASSGPWAALRDPRLPPSQPLPPLPTTIKWFPPPTYTASRPPAATPPSTGQSAIRDTFPPTAAVRATATPWPTTTAIATATAAASATAIPTETLIATPDASPTAVPDAPATAVAATSVRLPTRAVVRPVATTARDMGVAPVRSDGSETELLTTAADATVAPVPAPSIDPSRRPMVTVARADVALLDAIREALPIDPEAAAISVIHLETGMAAAINDDRTAVPASLYKVGVLAEAFRQVEAGQLRLGEPLRLLPTDWAPGAGILQGRIGGQISVADALRLMIGISDNVAAHAIVRRIGVDRVNANNQRLGLAGTRYYVDDRPDTTTANDMARLLSLLAQGRAAGPEATAQMIALMRQVQPAAWLPKGVPNTIPVAHKSGQLGGVRNDAGIVYGPTGPYVVVVLTDNRRNPGLGERAITAVARSVHAYFAAGG